MSHLERWSRRKRGLEADEETPHAVTTPASEPPALASSDAPVAPEPAPAPGELDETLPDPDTLPPGADIKAFLVPGVSEGLRRRALRRLFAADRYGHRDGLDDYDDDFRQRLQPLGEEVAGRLRRWLHEPEDTATEEEVDHATASAPEAPETSESQEDIAALDQGSVGAAPKTDQD